MTELLAPAGSISAVHAAVQNGADAVYMGFGSFNARRGAKNFSTEEMIQAIAYCRLRGVKTHITVNTLVSDRELPQLLRDVETVYRAGADALIVQDLGAARAIRAAFPDIELHASTQMTIHSLEGALFAKKQGFSRAVLSRELPMEEISRIARHAGMETEVFVHGALCMCYSGQCELSAVIGRRSGNRGLCAQPCRLPYGGRRNYPMSLKDLSLIAQLHELEQAGVTSFKIEGRMKRPEYVAIVTRIYSAVLSENRMPTAEELAQLKTVFSREGFTQGYYQDRIGPQMFGTRSESGQAQLKPLYEQAEKSFADGREHRTIPVSFTLCAAEEEPIVLHAEAGGCKVCVQAAPAERARTRATGKEDAVKALGKTGGTVFVAEKLSAQLDGSCMIPAKTMNALRREALERLTERLSAAPERGQHAVQLSCRASTNGLWRGLTAQVRTMEQAERLPDMQAVYVPLAELVCHEAQSRSLLSRGVTLVPVLPRIVWSREEAAVREQLMRCAAWGCTAALAGTVGEIALIRSCGLDVFGDFGLNAFNSETLDVLKDCGVQRQTVSFELRSAQIRDLKKPLETEMIVYGRLPLMVTENCMIAGKKGNCRRDGTGACAHGAVYLTDRTGAKFPVFREEHCRNTLYNAAPLALPAQEYQNLGITYGRLLFTVESPAQCAAIAQNYAAGKLPECVGATTRGLYHRGVE